MKFLKTVGVVLREIDTGDADKLIVVLTPDKGKITVSAVGAKRPRSKFVGCTEFLCYSRFDLFKTNDNYRLNDCQIIESFYGIRRDVIKLTYATYLSEILNDTIIEEHTAKRELKLFLNCLSFISSDKKDKELITAIFELRLLAIMGMAPFLDYCMICSSTESTESSFSFKSCGLVCGECLSSNDIGFKIMPGTLLALKHIVSQKIDKIFNFDVSEDVQKQLIYIGRRFISERLEKKYKSMDFLNKLAKA